MPLPTRALLGGSGVVRPGFVPLVNAAMSHLKMILGLSGSMASRTLPFSIYDFGFTIYDSIRPS
jgi:hypothetical protein